MTLKFCFKIGAPNNREMKKWGDYYLAKSLGDELTKLGHQYAIQPLSEWHTDKDLFADIVIHLRGLSEYSIKLQHFNIMWNISHPKDIKTQEYEKYDLILVSSVLYAKELSAKVSVPVLPFLQFADLQNFHPETDQRYKSELLFVGNSRKVLRQIIKDVLPCPKKLSIYGGGWEGFVDNTYVVSKWFPNEDLRILYSSCDILLNDHWADMKEYGFINNRFFEAIACNSIIINDDHPEIRHLFPDAIVYRNKNDLQHLITDIYENRERYVEVTKKLREEILTNHSAKHRAKQLTGILNTHFVAKKSANIQKKSIKKRLNELLLSMLGYGRIYRFIRKIYKKIQRIYEELIYIFKNRFNGHSISINVTNNLEFSDSKFEISFLVTDNKPDTTAGDYFSAYGLGEALARLYKVKVNYVARKSLYEWEPIPESTMLTIVMLHDSDIRKIRIPKGSKTIAWIRGFIHDWLKNPWINQLDGLIASSDIAFLEARKTIPELCWGIVPLGVTNDFSDVDRSRERDIDISFVGNIFNVPRDIVENLDLNQGFNFHFYGKLESYKNHPWSAYNKGIIAHSQVPEIYSRSKIVIEDTSKLTYGTINLRVFEAAACGALVIANKTPGLNEIFGNTVLEYSDREDLTEKIQYYLKHENERMELAEAARKLVYENHTFVHRARTFWNILENNSGILNTKKEGANGEC